MLFLSPPFLTHVFTPCNNLDVTTFPSNIYQILSNILHYKPINTHDQEARDHTGNPKKTLPEHRYIFFIPANSQPTLIATSDCPPGSPSLSPPPKFSTTSLATQTIITTTQSLEQPLTIPPRFKLLCKSQKNNKMKYPLLLFWFNHPSTGTYHTSLLLHSHRPALRHCPNPIASTKSSLPSFNIN